MKRRILFENEDQALGFLLGLEYATNRSIDRGVWIVGGVEPAPEGGFQVGIEDDGLDESDADTVKDYRPKDDNLPFGGSHAPDCPYRVGGECECWRSDPEQNPELDDDDDCLGDCEACLHADECDDENVGCWCDVCGQLASDCTCTAEIGPDESMDGDHQSGLASAGFGTDEDYGDFGQDPDYD